MLITMPVFETSGTVNTYTTSSLNDPWARQPNLPSLPPFSIAVLKPQYCLCRAQFAVISAALTVCGEYLNLKWLHSFSCKECSYLLTKTFIQIFNWIFLKISGRAAAFQPLRTSRPCLQLLYVSFCWAVMPSSKVDSLQGNVLPPSAVLKMGAALLPSYTASHPRISQFFLPLPAIAVKVMYRCTTQPLQYRFWMWSKAPLTIFSFFDYLCKL